MTGIDLKYFDHITQQFILLSNVCIKQDNKTYLQIDLTTEKQIDRQTDRQTYRQTETYREKLSPKDIKLTPLFYQTS